MRVECDGVAKGQAWRIVREDVASAYPWIPHALTSGFLFDIEIDDPPARIDLVGGDGAEDLGRLSTAVHSGRQSSPSPPEALALRVAGVTGEDFQRQGLKIFTDLMDRIVEHATPSGDWNTLP